jgi:hypothetical protein
MLSVSSIPHQPDEDRGRPRGEAARARPAGRNAPPQRRPPWDHAFAESPFGPLHYERAGGEQTVDVEGLLILYSTTSSLAALSRGERAALFARVRPLLTGPYRLPLRHELTRTRLAR